jgi:3-isopropylmalate/(R)-2-methylmalate dehydratase small subunit
MNQLNGMAHVYGDNIDTDAIIAGKYTKILDLKTFARHVLQDLDPGFKNRVEKGDILLAWGLVSYLKKNNDYIELE